LGVHVLDTHTGQRIRFDDDSRYATASTFKMLLAAAVLKRVDRGELSLAQRIPYSERDMLQVTSLVTEKHLAEGSLSLQELCAAIVEVSDNTAANLLLTLIGGPPAVTEFARELGDEVTRLDRMEPELNSNLPGDPRDTTSPRAMVGNMQKLFTGDVLSKASVNLLGAWMINATPGLGRIRAGIPKRWKAGDKAGTGAHSAVNDLAILWPPGRKPILVAIYMSESTQGVDALIAAHAEIASTLFDEQKIVIA
jgi:beta-lactamase class A